MARSLAGELEDKLAEQHSPARIVKYGVMCKAVHGFLILGCAHPDGFPAIFLDSLQKDEEITGYVLLSGSDHVDAAEEAQP